MDRSFASLRGGPTSWSPTGSPSRVNPPGSETTGQAAARETLEEAGARVELGPPFSMIPVPHVNQVHLFYRAKLSDLRFEPGEETLEVRMFSEAEIPWEQVAFRTVGLTLKRWFEDRAKGRFGFHAEDLN